MRWKIKETWIRINAEIITDRPGLSTTRTSIVYMARLAVNRPRETYSSSWNSENLDETQRMQLRSLYRRLDAAVHFRTVCTNWSLGADLWSWYRKFEALMFSPSPYSLSRRKVGLPSKNRFVNLGPSGYFVSTVAKFLIRPDCFMLSRLKFSLMTITSVP